MAPNFDFYDAFSTLTGYPPFPWQRRLFEVLLTNELPPAVDIPTGLGKTAVMAIWLLARAAGATLPRRLIYVVDRRAVVDQATEYAERIRTGLGCPALEPVRLGLGLAKGRLLPISTLRGRHVDNREWMEDPAVSAIIVGTVDMIGSRLLFQGYGVSRKMRPYMAGLIGCDTLVMLDEAHLSRPFERLLRQIEVHRHVAEDGESKYVRGAFAGISAKSNLPPPFRVLPLSATLGGERSNERFSLNRCDWENSVVHQRLCATKALTIEDLDPDSALDDVLASRAWELSEKQTTGKPPRLLIYCNSRIVAGKVHDNLRNRAKQVSAKMETILFVGGRRVHERQDAAIRLKDCGLIAGGDDAVDARVFVIATSAGEVGVDLDADHMVCDLVAWERMVQRLGRVNRRGAGVARVLVIDPGPPDRKNVDAAVTRHKAVRAILEALPSAEGEGFQAGPGAILEFGNRRDLQQRIDEASTPTPLYPTLTRPLINAWAMTSLAEHTGRPEVGPWLRGWMDGDEPRTTVVWRRYLPLRVDGAGVDRRVHVPHNKEIAAFFEAAATQTAELLETETSLIVVWLKKRAERIIKALGAPVLGLPPDADGEIEGPAAVETVLPPLDRTTPIAMILGIDGEPHDVLRLDQFIVVGRAAGDLRRKLGGRRLIVDARIGGLKDGLLDPNWNEGVQTIENNWGKPEGWNKLGNAPIEGTGLPAMRVRRLTDNNRKIDRMADDPWGEVWAFPSHVSHDEETQIWLVIEKWRGVPTDEESRAMASRPQKLNEHQSAVAEEAARIADALGLPPEDRAMLVAAARHHDNGKRVPRWQRAFNAPRTDGPYAKAGPCNRQALGGYRHEFQSTIYAAENGLDGVACNDLRFDLALHLIAAHHGHARPAIDIKGCDSLSPAVAGGKAHDIAMRFGRMQRHWGPWGLAWWEVLLRAADQRASRAFDEEATRTRETAQTRTSPEMDANVPRSESLGAHIVEAGR